MQFLIATMESHAVLMTAMPASAGEIFWPALIVSKFEQILQEFWPAVIVFSITVVGLVALRSMMSR